MPKNIALTGNIGCGKSTVAQIFARFPSTLTLSTDDLSKEILFAEEHSDAIRALLGLPDGQPFTPEMVGGVIWHDAERRVALETFIGSRLFERLNELSANAKNEDLIIVESAIIFEKKLESRFDGVIVAHCPASERNRRLMDQRGMAASEIELRLRLQLPQEELLRRADYCIDTHCTLDELERRARELYRQLTLATGEL